MENKVQITIEALDKTKAALAQAEKGFKGTFDILKQSVLSVQGALGGLTLGIIIKELFEAGIKAQALANSFKSITGTAAGAAREMEFLRREAERLGLNLYSSADAYKGLAAAAKGTALEGQATRDIFIAVSEAATVLGLSAETTQGALLALQQMVSKGTVAAEELRGQLGERLPGAFQLAAKAMGVSTAELGKMLEQGKVVAEDFLPKFAKALRDQYGKAVEAAADSATANFNRMKNAYEDLKVSFGESGVFDAMISGIKGTTNAIKELDMAGGALKRQWGMWDVMGQEIIIIAKQARVMATRAYNPEYQKEYDALQSQLEELRNNYRETYDEAYRLRRELERQGTGGLHEGKLGPPPPAKKGETDAEKKARAKAYAEQIKLSEAAADAEHKRWEESAKAGEDYNDAIFEATATQYEKDMKAADQWVQDQRNRLNDAAIGYEEYQAKLAETERAADEMRGVAHYEEMNRQIETATDLVKKGEDGKETITNQTYDRMRASMSDFLYAGIAGELESFKEIWEALWKSLARIAANALAEDLFKYMKKELNDFSGGGGFSLGSIVSGLGSLLGFGGGAGAPSGVGGTPGVGGTIIVHKGGYIPRFHFGGMSPDEIPAILQRGEYVVSRKGVDALDRINQGNVGGGTTINNYFNITATDAQGVDQWVRRNAGSFLRVVHEDLDRPGGLRNSISKALS